MRKKGQSNSIIDEGKSAKEFLQQALRCEEKKFKSVGLGYSCRYQGKKMVGAALEVDGSVPHLVFFSLDDGLKGQDDRLTHDNFPTFRFRKKFLFFE